MRAVFAALLLGCALGSPPAAAAPEPEKIYTAETTGELTIDAEGRVVDLSLDRKKLGEMLHKIDLKDGPAKFFPDGRVKFEENGRRVGAELCIVQWQKGRPTAVHPESIAAS